MPTNQPVLLERAGLAQHSRSFLLSPSHGAATNSSGSRSIRQRKKNGGQGARETEIDRINAHYAADLRGNDRKANAIADDQRRSVLLDGAGEGKKTSR